MNDGQGGDAVLYVLAAIGAVTTGVLLWKAFGPDSEPEVPRTVVAPDDDPDFLRDIDRRRRHEDGT